MTEKISASGGAHSRNAKSAGQRLPNWATGAAICAKMKSAKVLGQTDQNLRTFF